MGNNLTSLERLEYLKNPRSWEQVFTFYGNQVSALICQEKASLHGSEIVFDQTPFIITWTMVRAERNPRITFLSKGTLLRALEILVNDSYIEMNLVTGTITITNKFVRLANQVAKGLEA